MGLTRGVVVNSMMYGHNYEIVLNGLGRFPERLRAVIAPWSKITDRELEILTKAGVVGARFAHRLDPVLDERLVARVAEHGWSASYLGNIPELRPKILASPGRFVIEHAGHPPTAKGSTARSSSSCSMPRYRALLGQDQSALLVRGRFPVRRHEAIRAEARGARAQPRRVVQRLAASAIFQADAE